MVKYQISFIILLTVLLFSCRALKLGLATQDQVDDYDPALMFTIPRLAIVAGLVMFPDGPLNLDREPRSLSELFRPFRVSVGLSSMT